MRILIMRCIGKHEYADWQAWEWDGMGGEVGWLNSFVVSFSHNWRWRREVDRHKKGVHRRCFGMGLALGLGRVERLLFWSCTRTESINNRKGVFWTLDLIQHRLLLEIRLSLFWTLGFGVMGGDLGRTTSFHFLIVLSPGFFGYFLGHSRLVVWSLGVLDLIWIGSGLASTYQGTGKE